MKTREELLTRIPKFSISAEIGVFSGDFSQNIIDIVNPRVMYLVDLFSGQMISGDKNGENIRQINLYQSYFNLFKRYLNNPSVRLYRGPSAHFLALLPDDYLDFVYIDGDHSYQGAKMDLELARNKVRSGGYICGHDYTSKFPGVIQAVDEFCCAHKISLELTEEDKCPSFLIENTHKKLSSNT